MPTKTNKAQKVWLKRIRKLSTPLNLEQYPDLKKELNRIMERNSIALPTLKVLPLGMLSISPLFTVGDSEEAFIHQELLNSLSEKAIAHLIIHEKFHMLADHKARDITKNTEYITDRVAAAMIGNAESYKKSIREMLTWKDEMQEKAIVDNLDEIDNADDLNAAEKQDARNLLNSTVKKINEQSLKLYGTNTERLANIQQDIDRRNSKSDRER